MDRLFVRGVFHLECRIRGFKTWRFKQMISEKLEKAGTVDKKKHLARKVGTRSRQCRPKFPGRFAFPGARNPRICSISRFGFFFQQFSLDFPGVFRVF